MLQKKTDQHHESPHDLPVAVWLEEVDQPAFKIIELGNRIASEFKAMETVFLSFHWVFSGAKWKKEFKKGKNGRIAATNAKTLPYSVIIYI